MIGKRDSGPINATDELNRRDEEHLVDAGRGKGAFDAGRKPGMRGGKALVVVGLVGAMAVTAGVAVMAHNVKSKIPKVEKKAESRKIATGLAPEAVDPAELTKQTPAEALAAMDGAEAQPIMPMGGAAASSAGAPASSTTVPALTGGATAAPASTSAPAASSLPKGPSAAELLHKRRLSGALGDFSRQPIQVSTGDAGRAAPQEDQGGISASLKPMRLTMQQAAQLADRSYLLTQGAMIDCVLETKMVSTVPGMAACRVTRDIYSANGRVVLIDRGSKVVGFYQGGLAQGEARIFVQWSRLETPQGVVVNLDSPGTGALGEGGVGGYVDTHFKERFGGAILLSVIHDAGEYLANSSRNGNSQSFQFGNTQDAAQELARTTLQNSINIRPTMYVNQGSRVAIFVGRDLDFRGVYDLARK